MGHSWTRTIQVCIRCCGLGRKEGRKQASKQGKKQMNSKENNLIILYLQVSYKKLLPRCSRSITCLWHCKVCWCFFHLCLNSKQYKQVVTYFLLIFYCSRETYNALANWLTDARTLASPNIVIILVGNKKDLDSEREVTFMEASRFAQENGYNL